MEKKDFSVKFPFEEMAEKSFFLRRSVGRLRTKATEHNVEIRFVRLARLRVLRQGTDHREHLNRRDIRTNARLFLSALEENRETLLHRSTHLCDGRSVIGEAIAYPRTHAAIFCHTAIVEVQPLDERLPGIGCVSELGSFFIQMIDAVLCRIATNRCSRVGKWR